MNAVALSAGDLGMEGIDAAAGVARVFAGIGAVTLLLLLASVLYAGWRLTRPLPSAGGFGAPPPDDALPDDAPPQSWAGQADATEAMLAARMASYEQTPGDR